MPRGATEQDRPAEDLTTAIHEAGHAVAALALGLPLVGATIETYERGRLGYVEICDPRDYCWPGEVIVELVEASCTMLRAGGRAEWLLLGHRSRGDGIDRAEVRTLTRDTEGARRRADRLVRRNAGAIRRVAVALLVDHRLPAEAIEAICTDVPRLRRQDRASQAAQRAAWLRMDRHWCGDRRRWELAMMEEDDGDR